MSARFGGKGFVITPVIFIAAALVVVSVVYGSMALNSRAVSAINNEAALAKLQADEMENRIKISNSLYWFSLAANSTNCTVISDYVQSAMQAQGRNGTVLVVSGPDGYTTEYSEIFSSGIGPAQISKNVTVAKMIPGSCN